MSFKKSKDLTLLVPNVPLIFRTVDTFHTEKYEALICNIY